MDECKNSKYSAFLAPAKTREDKCQIHPANGEPEPRPLSLGVDGDTTRSESNQANPIRNRYRCLNRGQMRGNNGYLIGVVDRETGTSISRALLVSKNICRSSHAGQGTSELSGVINSIRKDQLNTNIPI